VTLRTGAAERYRTFWERFIASLLDGLVLLPVSVPSAFVIGYGPRWLATGWVLLTFPVAWLYTSYCHGRWGQTIGKRAVGIAVVREEDEGPAGYRRAVRRDLGTICFAAIAAAVMLALIARGETDSFRTLDRDRYRPSAHSEEFSVGQALRDSVPDLPPWYLVLIPLQEAWLLLELGTMLSNSRRRALHDYIGGTVVVKLETHRTAMPVPRVTS
jgi:uncharacterized RDD family membrane protein YckC